MHTKKAARNKPGGLFQGNNRGYLTVRALANLVFK